MKKSVIMIPLLLSATLVTIIFGQKYSANQREEMDGNQIALTEDTDDSTAENTAADKEPVETPADSQNLLSYYEENSESLSLYEYLDYLSLKNGDVSLAYYGDIDLQESWVSDLNTAIDEAVSGDLNMLDHSQSDSDTYDLYIQQTPQLVIDEKPDVIIYKLPALPDKLRDMGLSETEEFMRYILNSLVTLEETKLLLLEPYPVPSEINQVNSRSLDYRSYLDRMHTVAEAYDLTIIPLHSTFVEETSRNDMASYYTENDRLNEDGTRSVVSILDAFFNEEL